MIESCHHVELSELQQALTKIFAEDHLAPRRIVRLEREPSACHSSFPLEELTIWFADGESLKLIFKNLNPRALSVEARAAKPEFLDDPLREIELYCCLLDSRQLGTAFCYGWVVDVTADRYWLFLEKVEGHELYQVGEFDIWRQTARWLAHLHSRYRNADGLPPAAQARLMRYDAAYYECWLERANSYQTHTAENLQTPEQVRWQQLAQWYPQVVCELTALPTVLIHGEFYASNVIVQGTLPSLRVCPVDWERAALGPGLIDLAALVAGNWTEVQKCDLALQYLAELQTCGIEAPQPEVFLRELHLCRLHLAVQWLGWSRNWSPPQEHQQDWLAEAVNNARALGCPMSPLANADLT